MNYLVAFLDGKRDTNGVVAQSEKKWWVEKWEVDGIVLDKAEG